MTTASANFAFLAAHDPQLMRLGTLAERYFRDDPATCIIKLRQFDQLLTQLTAAQLGLYESPDETQADLLRRLKLEGATPYEVIVCCICCGSRAIRRYTSTSAITLRPLPP